MLLKAPFLKSSFFFLSYLFIHDRHTHTHRGRDTGRGRSRPHAGSLMWDSIHPGWHPTLKGALNRWATGAALRESFKKQKSDYVTLLLKTLWWSPSLPVTILQLFGFLQLLLGALFDLHISLVPLRMLVPQLLTFLSQLPWCASHLG